MARKKNPTDKFTETVTAAVQDVFMPEREKPVETTSLSLYDCVSVVRDIEQQAEQSGGEISDEQVRAIVATQTQSVVALTRLVGAIKHYESATEFCKAEEKRIAEKRKSVERRIESVKKYLLPYVEGQGGKVEAGTFTLTSKKNPPRVIVPEGFDDELYCREIPAHREPDKAAIKTALQAGQNVPWCSLEQDTRLEIK